MILNQGQKVEFNDEMIKANHHRKHYTIFLDDDLVIDILLEEKNGDEGVFDRISLVYDDIYIVAKEMKIRDDRLILGNGNTYISIKYEGDVLGYENVKKVVDAIQKFFKYEGGVDDE